MSKAIPFSPPDITQAEIDEVVDTLKSGWITTGPKTKHFEKEISAYCGTEKAVCLNSATAGLELVLRLLDIGKGDEVITTPYTYAASANVILHVGAKPVFVDIKENDFNIDPERIGKAITKRTKVIIPVDIGGNPADYNEINAVLEKYKSKYKPAKNTLQTIFDKPVILADAAHSFGSSYKGKKTGSLADFTVFSFHAVKNLTTAEGGAVTFNSIKNCNSEELYKKLMLLALQGQSKDALAKTKPGSWQYTIEIPGFKCNMTDIMASIGLVQLTRYDKEILPKREKLYSIFVDAFKNDERFILPPFDKDGKSGNHHLFPIRVKNVSEETRNEIIQKMAEINISCNVHFIPLPLHPVYEKLGYKISDYPNVYNQYKNEISLPLYSQMAEEDALYVSNELKRVVSELKII
jgi:dTDP-4-amino-4,6-dideoxygalactose transaminase